MKGRDLRQHDTREHGKKHEIILFLNILEGQQAPRGQGPPLPLTFWEHLFQDVLAVFFKSLLVSFPS